MKDIEQLFADHNIKSRPSHDGQYRMKCPYREFHQDGSGRESMFISTEDDWHHCFSCGHSGTLMMMLMAKKGLSVYEALEYISKELEEFDGDPNAEYEDRIKTIEVPKEWTMPLPIKVPDYYLKRGFDEETLRHFKVGEYYDKKTSRNIVSVPVIMDNKPRSVIYRLTHVKKQWFSSGTPRERMIYNFSSKVTGDIDLVEGYSDVWALWQLGRDWPMGSMGTELSTNQIELLKTIEGAEVINIWTDNDDPGMMARERWNHLLQDYFDCRFPIYEQQDPGEIQTSSQLKSAISDTLDYGQYSALMFDTYGEDYEELRERSLSRYL